MSSSFRDHMLSEAEMTWLKAVYEDSHFDPKMAKVRLRDKLPKGFDPKKIDARFLLNGKILTILGIWKVDPESPVLKNLERVILTIRDLICEASGIETITSELLSTKLGLQEPDVQRALGHLTTLGGFYSGASGHAGSAGYSRIELIGDDIYDAYLAFESLESLMQEYYERHEQHSDASEVRLPSTPGTGGLNQAWPPTSYLYYPQSTVAPYQIKRNTAFVLMPMDRENPELEDVYETIKQVCDSFGVHAYRADEIQHQDRITDLILSEIKLCELLVADLSYERPNVYYEIGYAHALQKRPILYRKNGTRLHFDLSVHNVPEYRNITELKSLLHKRLEAIQGRSVTSPSL
jgi:hypothetical protein